MSDYIDFVRQERFSRDDGLIQRFHICAPKPVYYKSTEIMSVPAPDISLTVLLFIVHKLNMTPIKYTLDDGAKIVFYEIFDAYKDYSDKFASECDMFIT